MWGYEERVVVLEGKGGKRVTLSSGPEEGIFMTHRPQYITVGKRKIM
jgi:hypothetical protein